MRTLLIITWSLHALFAGNIYYNENFDNYDSCYSHFGDTVKYKLVTDTFGIAAKIANTDSTKIKTIIDSIPVDSLLGWKILLSAWTKTEQLSTPPAPYNGVKVMLIIRNNDQTTSYFQIKWPQGRSHGWMQAERLISISPDVQWLKLLIGLEKVSGSVFFDSIRITRVSDMSLPPPRNASIPIPAFSSTRLRGAMIGTRTVDSTAITTFGSIWKGNLLRWQLNAPYNELNALARSDFKSLLQAEIEKINKILPICRAHGIKLIIDMHTLALATFSDTANQSQLINAWKTLAQQFHDNDAIWGYDLVNEPNEDSWREGALLWNDLADTLARTIRKIDTSTVIIVEPALFGQAKGFPYLCPVGSKKNWDINNIVYSFHFYAPFSLTHQGVANHATIGAIYPGTIENEYWDSTRMHKELLPAVAFQQKYRVALYVGEFSCIRWAPQKSALAWLNDLIQIMEHYGWDWSYHAYHEWEGWSVEYSDSKEDLRTPLETDRKELLLHYYAKNKNPYIASPIALKQIPIIVKYPNVKLISNATGQFWITGLEESVIIKLFNMRGVKVGDFTSKKGIVMIDGNHFARGLYLCRVIHGKKSLTTTMVLRK